MWLLKQVKYLIKRFDFLEVLNSPFVGLRLKFYFGEIKQGVPYFLPRKWVKSKTKDGCLHPVSITRFGLNVVSLGWKPKWDDYRFEWSPMISVVFFGKQFVIWFLPNIKTEDNLLSIDCYWEGWLTYKYRTSGTRFDRVKQLIEKYECTWVSTITGDDGIKYKKYEDYMSHILKNKWVIKSGYKSKSKIVSYDCEE